MSALRISRPGIAGTTLIDLGPDSPHKTRSGIGGVLVVAESRRTRENRLSRDVAEKKREYERRYYAANPEKAAERQRRYRARKAMAA